MPISLDACLKNNSDVLGEEYCNLGKKSPATWTYHKVFLSYSDEEGWGVKELNIFQRILRNVFGFYKDTHFKNVHRRWWNLQDSGFDNNILDNRLKHIWQKSYLTAFEDTNAAPNEGKPKVYCIGEIHPRDDVEVYRIGETHPHDATTAPNAGRIWTYRRTANEFIRDRYKNGDIILVEGVPAGEDARNNAMVRYLKGDYLVRGWDTEDPITAPKMHVDKCMKFIGFINDISNAIPNVNNYTLNDLGSLEEKITHFLEELPSFAKYFRIENTQTIKNAEKILQDFIKNKDKNNTITKFKVDWLFCDLDLKDLFNTKQVAAFVLNHPGVSATTFEEACNQMVKRRNQPLCKEIDRYVNEGRNVFVIGGNGHLYNSSYGMIRDETLSETIDTLRKHSAVIITKAKSFGWTHTLFNLHLKKVPIP